MGTGGLYEQVLANLAGGPSAPPKAKPPRASASVVLWRRHRGAVEVYWIKRARTMRFMGGFHAFPGGGIEPHDREGDATTIPPGVVDGPVDGAMPVAVTDGMGDLGPVIIPGLVRGLLRELHEEMGLELSAESGAQRLVYAGRWLTPPLGPLRFDNRFFLLEWPEQEAQQPRVASSEAEEGEWIRPAAALDRWQTGEIVTAPPILHILQVLAEVGPVEGLGRMRAPVQANLGPHRRIEFRPGVLLFPMRTPTLPPASYTNTYVLGRQASVLVDPGSPYELEIEWLVQALVALQRQESRSITAIWLTHHHPDHIGGVQALRKRLEVPVYAHRQTAERLAEVGIPLDGELADEQVVRLDSDGGFPVRILHTPGHARGHLCFLEEEHGSMLVGDLIAGLGTIVIDPPEGDMGEYLRSLRRVRDLEPQALFPAHGPMSLDAVAKLEDYVQHRLWREGRILETWRAGVRQTSEMVEQVYDDVPRLAHPLAERQILAHLEHLRANGELEE